MHTWLDKYGNAHKIGLTVRHARRIKACGVIDLIKHVENAELWDKLFEQIQQPDISFDILCVLEGVDHTDEAAADRFADLFSDGGQLMEARQALLRAVIDFFPFDQRAAIRQLYVLTQMKSQIEAASRVWQSAESESPTATNGSGESPEPATSAAPTT